MTGVLQFTNRETIFIIGFMSQTAQTNPISYDLQILSEPLTSTSPLSLSLSLSRSENIASIYNKQINVFFIINYFFSYLILLNFSSSIRPAQLDPVRFILR
ncbi:hypothetical protein WN943_002914 [Citrus x changshan-huyou]